MWVGGEQAQVSEMRERLLESALGHHQYQDYVSFLKHMFPALRELVRGPGGVSVKLQDGLEHKIR